MKHYLDLVGISSKVRRRQSRMTRLCIVLAVFLVTAIFGMADMEIANQRRQAVQQYGSWHAAIKSGISEEDGTLLSAWPEVVRSGWYGAKNSRLGDDFTVNGRRVAVCGCDQSWFEMFPGISYQAGGFPAESGTVSMTENAKTLFGIQLEDTITLSFPDGADASFRVTGFFSDTSMMLEQDGAGLLFNSSDYKRYFSRFENAEMWYYIELTPFCNMQRVFRDIRQQFGLSEDQLGQNPKLMGLSGQSNDPYMHMLYSTAAVLALLVTISGVLMMTGSLNSSVAQRTEFFGLLRCLGATPRQVRRFVRREALGWCRSAVPLGLLAGTAVVWVLCGILRVLVPNYFSTMPRFGVSLAALVSGSVVGVLTVLLAARTPAKRAAEVSPLAAASGNAGTVQAAKRAADTRLFRVETALGIHHAVGSRRNFTLMAGSFAFSIVLFLSFSAMIDFMHHAVNPLHPSRPDFSIISPDESCSVPVSMAGEIARNPAIARVYGHSFAPLLEGSYNGQPVRVNLFSYEENQFRWARQSRLSGDFDEAEEGRGLLYAYGADSVLETGGFLTLGGYALPVSGCVTYSPYEREPGIETVFCSEELFHQLTGESGYTAIDVQFSRGETDAAVAEIRALAGEGYRFSDRRLSNREGRGAYYSVVLFVYGFLAVIALIAVFHIVNSIALSVSARMRQYGAMRAIGMSGKQLTRMVLAEALTYACGGFTLGIVLGVPLHWLIFSKVVTFQWGDPWMLPWQPLLVIVLVMLGAVLLAAAAPARRIRSLSITDTISAE